MLIIILISLYVFPTLAMWFYIKVAMSKGGRWEHRTPSCDDLCMTLIPIMNLIAAIVGWVAYPPHKKIYDKKCDASKFYSIKK